MKLFIHKCGNCNNKIYIDIIASSRSELRQKLGGNNFNVICNSCGIKNLCTVDIIYAESDSTSAVTGGLVGGLLGILGGPLGIVIGGGLGALIGNTSDEDERKNVKFFNNSR